MKGGDRVCVIGAGSSGLTAARNLLANGFDVDILESEGELGGIWNCSTPASRVYESTTMISSKPFTQFPDFPMPAEFPDYPSHRETLGYLVSYATAFGLTDKIRFDARVETIRRNAGTGWTVISSRGVADYRAIVVASGHNWSPKMPVYEGRFDGRVLHSAVYRAPGIFDGKRVLIVGQGNSGCDIAVEALQSATCVFSSSRRGYHFIPRFFSGRPADQMGDELLAMGVPLEMRRQLTRWAIESELGDLSASGLLAPDHELFETHPIINTDFPLAVRDRLIVAKPGVARMDGHRVEFIDGTSERIDVIVMATGYRIDVPFLEEPDFSWNGSAPSLHLNIFHRHYDDLFFAGFIQPDSGQFGLVHWQMRAVALYLRGLDGESESARRLQSRKRAPARASSGGVNYMPASRHALEVEHWSYRNEVRALAEDLEG